MIAVAGINHFTARLGQLSRVSSAVKAGEMKGDLLLGSVYIETCNRIELYAEINLDCQKAAEKILLQQLGLKKKPAGLYIYFGDEAMLHLLKVAAGLDSAILGEDQVLHQLKKAYSAATDKKLNSPLLNKLFHKAFETGKLVRSLTGINKGNVSVASIASGLVQSFHTEYPGSASLPILIIGAGETGALVTQILVAKGFRNILIWNRTAEKAKNLAGLYGVEAIQVKALPEHYKKAGVILIAINKRSPVIDFSVTIKGKNSKRILIDLSLPIQVDEQIIPKNTILYNLEHIAEISRKNSKKRQESADDALQLVWASLHELKAWQEQEWVGQTLQQWQVLLHQIQERQLKLFEKENPGADLKALADFGRALSANLLRQLAWTIRQQEKAGNEDEQWSRILSSVEPYEQLN